jgi:tRNA(Arg) A34 adenosine deaminase TadA
MERAIELSRKNLGRPDDGGPFGAVIVKSGQIVGEGYNSVLRLKDPTCHAEVMAIRDACQNLGTHDLSDCEIYTSCEPCPMCLSAIYWSRMGTIYFGNSRKDAERIGFDDDFIYQQIPIDPLARKIPSYQCLKEEAGTIFDEWSRIENKMMY